jgi:hypothetical protein
VFPDHRQVITGGRSSTRRSHPLLWLVGSRPPSGQTVDLGHELPVGVPGGLQFLGALLELLAQVRRGLLQLGDLAAQRLGLVGGGGAEAAGAEGLLAERVR